MELRVVQMLSKAWTAQDERLHHANDGQGAGMGMKATHLLADEILRSNRQALSSCLE